MKNFSLQFLVLSAVVGLFLLIPGTALGQHEVSGTVVDSTNGSSLPGANIVVKGTTRGTTTDATGGYQLEAPAPSDTLVVSFVGYTRKEVPIRGRNQIDVALAPSTLAGEELVVVGYGEQQRQDLTGSVGVVDTDEMKKMSSESIAEALKGNVAGVTVQSTGAPGEPASVKIRGPGTFGNNEPLYVIDGVPVESLEDFNLQDIESMQVLKGPSASAIYGSRAANGVVVITTNTGTDGEVRVNYNAEVGYQNIHQRLDVTNAEQYREINNKSRANAGLPPAASNDPDSPEFVDDVDNDWQDIVFQPGLQNDHSLTISSGNENNSYSVSLGYIKQENTFTGRAPQYSRYSARVKSDHEITDNLTLGQSIYYSKGDRINQTSRHAFSIVTYTLRHMPTARIYDESHEGGYAGPPAGMEEENSLNPVGANNLLENYDDIGRFLGNVWGEYEIIDNLTYKLNVSYDNRRTENKFFVPSYNLGVFFINERAELTESNGNNTKTLIENTLNYQNTIGSHNIDVLIGYTEERNNFKYTEGHAEGFSKPYFKVLNAGSSNITVEGLQQGHNLRSFLGRINYSYDDKYLLTTSVRRDGSSRFSQKNRYGVFPSASVGWRISEESFFDVGFINDLKIRGEYGVLGNQEIGNYQYQATVSTSGVDYNFGNSIAPGAIQTELVDPNIKWESNTTGNVGLDLSLFNNVFELTAEYYYSESSDLLVGVPIPESVGSSSDPIVNAASIKNSGFEVAVTYSNVTDEFEYSLDANLTTVNNEVLSLGGGEPIFGFASRTAVGREVGEIYGWVRDGLFQSEQEVEDHAFQSAETAPGDIRFKDLNGDGLINGQDRQYLGSPIPDFTYGLGGTVTYSNWDLSLRFTGNYGNKIYNNVRQQLEGTDLFWNYTTRKLDYWTPDNRDTDIPRPVYQDPNGNDRTSDRWVEDGSYIKLQNVQISYSVPSGLIDRFGVRNLTFGFNVQNVFTLSKYRGLDPDLGTTGWNNGNDGLFSRGVDSGSFPHPRIYTFEIQLGL